MDTLRFLCGIYGMALKDVWQSACFRAFPGSTEIICRSGFEIYRIILNIPGPSQSQGRSSNPYF